MPSSPSLQACLNTSGPSSSSMCSLNRRPAAVFAMMVARVVADLKRIEPKVITIKLNQVERPHENALVILPISDVVE
jgi:hypothetical protein